MEVEVFDDADSLWQRPHGETTHTARYITTLGIRTRLAHTHPHARTLAHKRSLGDAAMRVMGESMCAL